MADPESIEVPKTFLKVEKGTNGKAVVSIQAYKQVLQLKLKIRKKAKKLGINRKSIEMDSI